MKKIIISILLLCSVSFALSLDDVKRGLKSNSINEDSLEMKFKTTISSPLMGTQTMESYNVRKGPDKIYFEMKGKLINQRMIVSGRKMKLIDLKTNAERIMNTNPEMLKKMQSPVSNPMENGNWKNPVLVSGNVYRIDGDSATVYYDAAQKRLIKMEQNNDKNNTLITFEYNPSTKQMSAMRMSIMIESKETKIDMEFSKYQSSKNFPDRFFDF